MLCSKLSQSSMGPDIKGKSVYGKFPIPSHKLASLRSASKKMEKVLQENGSIHRKQHKVHFSVHVLVVLAHDV